MLDRSHTLDHAANLSRTRRWYRQQVLKSFFLVLASSTLGILWQLKPRFGVAHGLHRSVPTIHSACQIRNRIETETVPGTFWVYTINER